MRLSRIVEMNLGFLGIQFSFGLQQANMGPIYRYLGADEANLPLFWLAGPATGLIVQPIVGALSDRTVSRLGRRTPYFLLGAILCSIGLFLMPYSPTLWFAASLLWMLDAANNITMEPYRAYVRDRLNDGQLPLGFLMQSAFTGLGQTLSYLAPSLLVWWGFDANLVDPNGIPRITRIAFMAGAVLSLSTILWSVIRVPELPMAPQHIADMRRQRLSPGTALRDFIDALRAMPPAMRQLAPSMLCQWFAMFAYWQYVAFALARSFFSTGDPDSGAFRQGVLLAGQAGALYNALACVAAFAMVPISRHVPVRYVHAVAVSLSGMAMIAIPHVQEHVSLFLLMSGIGIGWASMMGNPYVLLARAVPPERTGVYMGIFNMFIVVPMLLETLILPLVYRPLLGGDPRAVLAMAGGLMLLAGATTLMVRSPARKPL